MKKLVVLLLLLSFAMTALCACGSDDRKNSAESSLETGTAATEAAKAAPVDASWFDDAVFIGDSITLALDYACTDDATLLSKAQFVCAQSLGYHNALWDLDAEYAVHPTYRGDTILAETAAEKTGASKVFILLGVNDIGTYGAEDTMEQAKVLAQRILSHTPNVTLYFQSTTPMIAAKEGDWLNNTKITDFNTLLQAYCKEQGYYYLDVYHQVADAGGALNPDYCGDPDNQGIHFTVEGCKIWADYLKAAVAEMPPTAHAEPAPTAAPPTEAPPTTPPTAPPATQPPAPTAAPVTEAAISGGQNSANSEISYSAPADDDPDEINFYVSQPQQ